MGTDERCMAFIRDEISRAVGLPAAIGGIPLDEIGATGVGLCAAIDVAKEFTNLDLAGARVAIQGFGNVGHYAAEILAREYGCKIVALSDVSGGLYASRGLPLSAIYDFKQQAPGQYLEAYSSNGYVDRISNQELLTLDVDVLIPAAIEDQITARNAEQVLARVIVEGANGPTTFEADAILRERGAHIVPDILANAGGVICSYLEWVQDLQWYFWGIDEIRGRIHSVMVNSFQEVWQVAQQQRIDLRSAAYILAVQRVARAIDQRGIFP
jgi:glutamate dehydrogenase (NAD(P)+)